MYGVMASDVSAVMGALRIEKAGFVGWRDGAYTASWRVKLVRPNLPGCEQAERYRHTVATERSRNEP
jgi:hypothetical protein